MLGLKSILPLLSIIRGLYSEPLDITIDYKGKVPLNDFTTSKIRLDTETLPTTTNVATASSTQSLRDNALNRIDKHRATLLDSLNKKFAVLSHYEYEFIGPQMISNQPIICDYMEECNIVVTWANSHNDEGVWDIQTQKSRTNKEKREKGLVQFKPPIFSHSPWQAELKVVGPIQVKMLFNRMDLNLHWINKNWGSSAGLTHSVPTAQGVIRVPAQERKKRITESTGRGRIRYPVPPVPPSGLLGVKFLNLYDNY